MAAATAAEDFKSAVIFDAISSALAADGPELVKKVTKVSLLLYHFMPTDRNGWGLWSPYRKMKKKKKKSN